MRILTLQTMGMMKQTDDSDSGSVVSSVPVPAPVAAPVVIPIPDVSLPPPTPIQPAPAPIAYVDKPVTTVETPTPVIAPPVAVTAPPPSILAPGKLVGLSQAGANKLAFNYSGVIPTTIVAGIPVPTSAASMQAGSMAIANALTLDLQNGRISQAIYDQAIAALTPIPQTQDTASDQTGNSG